MSEPGTAAGTGTVWDVVVIGAGPAGSVAAGVLAREGLRVLLVEKERFPRGKACGGCLSAAGCALLEQAGFAAALAGSGAARLHSFTVRAGGAGVTLPLRPGVVVERAALDAALVAMAAAAGVTFAPQTRAMVGSVCGPLRSVWLGRAGGTVDVRARIVLVADGLAGQSLREVPHFAFDVVPGALVGGSTTLPAVRGDAYARHVIHMACGRAGYVGLVRLADGRLHVAAALAPAALRGRGGLGGPASELVVQAGFADLPELAATRWDAVPQLTRRRAQLAAERLFVLGDAAGYVEPFTGEGMTWALTAALAVVPLARACVRHGWRPDLATQWTGTHRMLLGGAQRRCALTAALLRRPALLRVMLGALNWWPALARPYTNALGRCRAVARARP